MTALFCFIDQRIASLLYSHYRKELSLYKCCLSKFGFTTIIVLFQILFDRRCTLRKPQERNLNDIELSYPTNDTNQQSRVQLQPSNFNQTPASFTHTPSFNIKSAMKSSPRNSADNSTKSNDRNFTTTRIDFDAIESSIV